MNPIAGSVGEAMQEYALRLPVLQGLCRSIAVARDPAEVATKLAYLLRFAQILSYEIPHTGPIWRGRKCPDPKGFENISDLGAPPAAIAPANRLNEAGHPLLYVSTNKFAVLEEIAALPGQYVHLIAYTLDDRLIHSAIVGEITHVHRWRNAPLGETMSEIVADLIKSADAEIANSLIFADAYFSSVLSDSAAKDSAYLHSRTLARLIFEKLPDADAITYPGVAVTGSYNMAFRVASARRLLRPNASRVVRVDSRYDYGLFDYTAMRKVSAFNEGAFEWAGSARDAA